MAFSSTLRKNFAAVLVVPVALIALLSIEGVGRLSWMRLGAERQLARMQVEFAHAPLASPRRPFHSTSAAAILARNAFDSTARPILEQAAGGDGDSDPINAPACEGVKVLAIVASADPDWSFAAFEDGRDPRSLLRRRGGDVGAHRVEFIAWDRVWMGKGSRLCQAVMFTGGARDDGRPDAGAGAGGLDPTIARAIQRVSPTEFRVDRGVVPRIIEEQAVLLSGARVLLEQENGKVVGLRISGVRPDSLLGSIGIENGDRLQTVNGFDVAKPEAALEAYGRLQQAEHIVVVVNRRGRDLSLDYDIR